MVQKDYLLRQIEKMGVILAGIREKCFAGEPVQALILLREFAAREGVELSLLGRLAPQGLLSLLGADNLAKLLPAAEVFLLKAEIERRLGEEADSAASFEKATIVIARLEELIGSSAEPGLLDRLGELVARVEDYRGNGGRTD